ncbi:MAG: GGDEF domain-containing protein, partial [Comamonas sp.]
GSSTSGVLLMLDIDFFKSINDSWGHAAGDEVLKHLSTLLRQSLRLRNGDIAGRLGGEEFAILLPATDLRGGVQMAERLRELISSTPASTEHGPISFTASMGICIFDASLSSIDQGLERADAALYYAKRSGRNQVFTWNPTIVLTPPPASH